MVYPTCQSLSFAYGYKTLYLLISPKMNRKNWGSLIVFVLVFTSINSCKKDSQEITNIGTIVVSNHKLPSQADSCTSTPDCIAVGRYGVMASYHSRNGPNQIYDTIYGYTTITITEFSAGVIQFKDDSITHLKFTAFYDSSTLYGAGTTLFSAGGSYGVTIIIYPNDSVNIDYYTGSGQYGSANDWVGHKIQ